MFALRDWQNFYMLTGTAAATLIGLLFVAMSIAGYIPAKQAQEYTQTFVRPTLLSYIRVLLVSCLALLPLQSLLPFCIMSAILGGINFFLVFKILWRIRVVHRGDSEIQSDYWLWYVALPGIVSLLFIGGAIGIFFYQRTALLLISLAALLCLAIGLHNSWVLMIWLILHSRQSFGDSEHKSVSEDERVG